MSENKRQEIYVSYDIEKAGTPLIYPVLSVAFVVANRYNILETAKFNRKTTWPTKETPIIKRDDGFEMLECFEPRCWNEFWCDENGVPKQELVKPCLTPEPLEESVMWKKIAKFLDDLEVTYPKDKYKIIWLTDNPAFDTAHIDYNLLAYCNRNPTRTGSDGSQYMPLKVPDDMRYCLSDEQQRQIVIYADSHAPHDHDCLNDATNILYQYWGLLNIQDGFVMGSNDVNAVTTVKNVNTYNNDTQQNKKDNKHFYKWQNLAIGISLASAFLVAVKKYTYSR